MPTEEDALLAAVVAAPGDDAPRLVYADWLDDRGDPRGAYLRAELQWARPWKEGRTPAGGAAVRALTAGLNAVWAARVSRPPLGVCCDHLRFGDYCSRPRPPVRPADLDYLEQRFGLTLPADYRAFLLNTNGGEPLGKVCGSRLRNLHSVYRRQGRVDKLNNDFRGWDDDLINRLLYLERGRAAGPRVGDLAWRGEPERDLMAIGFTGPNGVYEVYALGCRGAVVGRVYNVDDGKLSGHFDCVEVAPSFAEFLAMHFDLEGRLPGHFRAVVEGDAVALHEWLAAGGDANDSLYGMSLLSHACHWHYGRGRAPVARALLEHGANVGDAELDQAERLGNQSVIRLMRARRPAGG